MKSKLKTNVARARTEAEITQRELAQSIGISLDYLKGLEIGSRPLTGTVAGLLAEKLRVTVDWLMEYDGAIKQWPADLSVEEKVNLLRDHLKEIIDGCFNLEAYNRGGLVARLSAPGFPEAQYSAVKAELKRLFNVPMPAVSIKAKSKPRKR